MIKSVAKSANRKGKLRKPVKPDYRTLQGWAIGTLLETHAIIECSEHGHIRDRGSWAHGLEEAKAVAMSHPFAGATPQACGSAIDEVMASIGDICPEC